MLDRMTSLVFLKKNAVMNLIAGVVLLLYYILCDSNQNTNIFEELSFMIIFLAGVIAEFVIIYFLNDKFYYDTTLRVIKFVMLMVLSKTMFTAKQDTYIIIICAVLYGMLVLQLCMLYEVTDVSSKIAIVAFYTTCPLVFFLFFSYFGSQNDKRPIIVVVFTAAIIILAISNLFFRFVDFSAILLKRVCELDDNAVVNKKERDEINIQSKKLVQINEQLSMERFKLKQANDTISRNNEEIRMQNEIVKAAVKALDMDKLMNYLIESAFNDLKADFVSFLICAQGEEDEDFVGFTKYSEASGISKVNVDIVENASYIEENFKNGEKSVLEQDANKLLMEMTGTEIQTFMAIPAQIGEHAKGLYLLGSVKPKAFSEREGFVESLIEHITLAIDNTLLYSRMHNMATKDGLTGIYNRRYFNSICNNILGEFEKERKPLSIVLFDIDKFKTVNDTYGHIFGDEVIRLCGQMAAKYGKAYDGLPVRYGGEEFVIVFQNKVTNEVMPIIQELHAEIRNHVFHYNDMDIQVNTSMGLACYPENCDDTESLLNAADTAMYCSKKNGRGRITIYSSDI